MALITLDDVKEELDIEGSDYDLILEVLINAVVSSFEMLCGYALEIKEETEYYSMDVNCSKIFLDRIPVTAIDSIYDDPDWDYDSTSLISSDDYTYDSEAGIVYYNGFFYEGKNNVKITYTAGFTTSTFPEIIKQVIMRQIAVWWKDSKEGNWGVITKSQPSGGGSISKKELEKGFLPEFKVVAEMKRRG